jgi:NADH-quinone oxidoreductase subunit L
MMIPLVVLAIGALFGGVLGINDGLGKFLSHSPSFELAAKVAVGPQGGFGVESVGAAEETSKLPLMALSAVISLAGIGLAWFLHLKNRGLGDLIAKTLEPVCDLLEHKYWVDEIYQAAIVEPLRALGRYFFAFDRFVVDTIVNMLGFIPQFSGFILKLTVQRGYLQGYAAAMLLGVAAILLFVFLR